jgi:hypothetical protein
MFPRLEPDPAPDQMEKKIRLGCGVVFGIAVGMFTGAFWLGLRAGWLWVFVSFIAIVFGFLSLRHGNHFWYGLLEAIRQAMGGSKWN